MSETTEAEAVTPLAFVDTETTGLDPRRHEIWEAAVIRAEHRPGRLVVLDEWTAQAEVHRLGFAEDRGLEIGRFHERRAPAADRVSRLRLALELEHRTRRRMMVGAVPSFDAGFMAELFLAQQVPASWHYQLVDVETLVAGWCVGEARRVWDRTTGESTDARARKLEALAQPPWNSDALLAAVGVTIPEVERHTALGDARWAMRGYAAVFGLTIEHEPPEPERVRPAGPGATVSFP